MTQPQTAVITGAGSGFGLETARLAALRGGGAAPAGVSRKG